jgi:hypothetical protein
LQLQDKNGWTLKEIGITTVFVLGSFALDVVAGVFYGYAKNVQNDITSTCESGTFLYTNPSTTHDALVLSARLVLGPLVKLSLVHLVGVCIATVAFMLGLRWWRRGFQVVGGVLASASFVLACMMFALASVGPLEDARNALKNAVAPPGCNWSNYDVNLLVSMGAVIFALHLFFLAFGHLLFMYKHPVKEQNA